MDNAKQEAKGSREESIQNSAAEVLKRNSEPSGLSHQVMDMLFKHAAPGERESMGKISLNELKEMTNRATSVSNQDLHDLVIDDSKKDPVQKKADAIAYSAAAANDLASEKTVNQLAAARLSDEQMAGKLKDQHLAKLNAESMSGLANGAGIVSTFGSYFAAKQVLNVLESSLPQPAIAKLAFSVGVALNVGGIVNNVVNGREMFDSTGFLSNALQSGIVYGAGRLLGSGISDPQRMFSVHLNGKTLLNGTETATAGLAILSAGSHAVTYFPAAEEADRYQAKWNAAGPKAESFRQAVVSAKQDSSQQTQGDLAQATTNNSPWGTPFAVPSTLSMEEMLKRIMP